MGRPRNFCEEQVLQQATETFWKLGFRATTLSDLCQATGLNRPSLYATFGDKEALFLRCIASYQDKVEGQFHEGLDQIKSPLDRLMALLRRHATFLDRGDEISGCLVVSSLSESRGLSENLQKVLQDIHRESLNSVSELLEEAVEARETRDDLDVRSTAELCITQLYGLATFACIDQGRANSTIEPLIGVLENLIKG